MILSLDTYLTSNHRHDNVMKDWTGVYLPSAMKTIALASEFASLAGFTITDITSGWRPEWLNRNLGGAASSKHVTAQAIDIADPDKVFGKWLAANIGALRERGCAIESLTRTHASTDPAGRWTHIQTIIPPSGNIIFMP